MMKTLIERVNAMFEQYNVKLTASEKVELESIHVLEDGTEVRADQEAVEEGAQLYIINDENERIILPEGEYRFKDGTVAVVGANGAVKSVNRGGNKDGDAVQKGQAPRAAQAPAESGSGTESATPSRDSGTTTTTKPPRTRASKQVNMEEENKEGS